MKVNTAIKKMKDKLIMKANTDGLYEDFGVKEVRQLEEKYPNSIEVVRFDEWCMNYTGNN
jgi:hypothetical protein